MDEWLLILGMALVTFGVRYPMLAVIGRLRLPDTALRALRYVPAAVLTAIVVPAVLMPDGMLDLRLENAYLPGAVVAALVAWCTKNLLLTIMVGMGAFLLLRALTG
ncbi:MAG: AzlD domain-containing protein [Chloroflexi bacterium]|nr:AzlD domain-containing protein [Chloroflexota bacterium]MDL1882359.1 AzlD domain-containing protein [Anaerolineae bacterium CFX8]